MPSSPLRLRALAALFTASAFVAQPGCSSESGGASLTDDGPEDGSTTGADGGASATSSAGGGDGGAAGTGGAGGGEVVPPEPTCDATAKTGDYCGGDKVTDGDPGTLYHCQGPGPATVVSVCENGCFVAPPGFDDYCESSLPACPHEDLLAYGLCPDASDRLRCAGLSAGDITQTIGNAPASAGTHAADGTIGGQPYCAATDLSTSGLSDAEVLLLLDELTNQGFAAFFRDPGHDGWPADEARHIHAIYVGVGMKAALAAQVDDWLQGLNGLASHTPYGFYQASAAQKAVIAELFEQYN